MRMNTANKFTETTHEGAPAARMSDEQALRRSVMSCLLWENEFYEDGVSIADRIRDLAHKATPATVAKLAIEARTKMNLRHAPLWLVAALVTHPDKTASAYVRSAVYNTVNRVDEMGELLAMIYGNQKIKLTNQLKGGLADCFDKFDDYQFQKYASRKDGVRVRDVMFMCHPKPNGREELFRAIAQDTLSPADTWEVALSGGADKRETFERLISEGKIGYLALLRNLRNMIDAGVEETLVKGAILERKGAGKVLPFRYVAAARHAPRFERELDTAMMNAVQELPKLDGKTAVLVDVSGSMDCRLSGKSDMSRLSAASALAALVNGDRQVFSFSMDLVEVAPRNGMALIDAINSSQPHGGTYLGAAVERMNHIQADRLIVITDEQTHDRVPEPVHKNAYMINVASNKNGVGYGRWTHIDGFTENIFRFIHQHEAN